MSHFILAQDYSTLWEGHFSYYNIVDVSQGNGILYTASENAVFSYDTATHELKTLTTVNGLSGESISTIHYSETYGLLLIGYQNGLMEIALDGEDDILRIIDILEKPTIPPTDKKINHFNEFEDRVYIATDYGISVYSLENLEFGDTYYIGTMGSQVSVKQTAVFNGEIYAGCQNGNGLKKAPLNSPNLIDYQVWGQLAFGNFVAVETFADTLYAFRNNGDAFSVEGNTLSLVYTYPSQPLDVKFTGSYLTVTTPNNLYVHDTGFTAVASVNVDATEASRFTCGTTINENLYIGTTDKGVLRAAVANPLEFIEIHPDGPLRNSPFTIQAIPNGVWVTFGDYSQTYNPGPLRSWGISKLHESTWENKPFNSVLGTRNLNTITVHPDNPNQVFISSYHDGLLEIEGTSPITLFNEENSALQSLVDPNDPDYKSIRISGSTFDNNGLFWVMNSRLQSPLKSYNPQSGQWQSHDFTELIPDAFYDNQGFSQITIDGNGTKWIGSSNYGVIGYNENGQQLKNLASEEEGMPNNYVSTVALDRSGQLWIGTLRGLRVLYNTSGFFQDESAEASQIIIEENGVGQELMYQQNVKDIEIDGGNNKWIGAMSTGLFYVSPNGQETIYHFTKDNSPLPSNNVFDVSIDDVSGTVYIATDKGLVAFKSGSSKPLEGLEDSYVYPNPVRPSFNILQEKVKIQGLSENVNIKITDIEGNLVAEAQSNTNLRHRGYNLEIDGGTAYWNGKNLANHTVASGVYLIMLSDLDSFETKVLKLMVVR